jgi:hypothetical protein
LLGPSVEQFESSVVDPDPVFNLFENPDEFWPTPKFFMPPNSLQEQAISRQLTRWKFDRLI